MDGDVSGADTISSYTGTYVQDGDKFAATIAVTQPGFFDAPLAQSRPGPLAV